MGSVPGKQRPSSFVETVQVQSAPMEDSPTKHGFLQEYTRSRSSPSRPVNRSRALPHNLSCNNISNKSSPNTPRFGDSLPSFASLKADELPDVDSEQAATTAKLKLHYLLAQLETGKPPTVSEMKATIRYAADVLTQHTSLVSDLDSDENFDEVQDEEVRAWLAATFTKRESVYTRETTSQVPRFKTVAQLLVIGNYVHSRYKWASQSGLQIPADVTAFFGEHISNWNCDMFQVEKLTNNQPLRYTTYELFQKCDLPKRHEVMINVLDNFLIAVENGYKRYKNPYHNSTHAADVVQTVYCLVKRTGIMDWMTSLELLAILIAAAIHDVEHTGTTNSFHMLSNSELALLYNDKSVLENHHLHTAFKLMQDKDLNVLKSLKQEDYRLVRGLIIDMVLATDMSCHFEQIKTMKNLLSSPEAYSTLDKTEKSKVLSLILHCADISHPAKSWDLHSKWTPLLMEEFFRQGDQEKELKRQCSPLCDRNTTLVPESQVGFIDVIVVPTYEVMGNMIDLIMSSFKKSCKENGSSPQYDADFKPWTTCLSNNRKQWKERCSTKPRVSQTNSEQSKTNQVASSRRTSTVETKKISRLETTKATSNGETHHKVDTNETETQNKVVDNGPKDNASPEASKSDSGHETSDTQTDDAVVNPTQDMATELPNKDHSQVPLKNQI
ncbi:dual specificity calcium/calmodulin-dependent 3',5'-cyclic nucleotide phosphodiesterase 1A-like [Dysidea avara]|uniref:dual specificity calcium/calmodulin-dependent 3',5'-cyclic nucleotide phosphodiesterase 1A-like n=1 Tax=Dysidea avara TaxID=196820 RepID=UPI003325289A